MKFGQPKKPDVLFETDHHTVEHRDPCGMFLIGVDVFVSDAYSCRGWKQIHIIPHPAIRSENGRVVQRQRRHGRTVMVAVQKSESLHADGDLPLVTKLVSDSNT